MVKYDVEYLGKERRELDSLGFLHWQFLETAFLESPNDSHCPRFEPLRNADSLRFFFTSVICKFLIQVGCQKVLLAGQGLEMTYLRLQDRPGAYVFGIYHFVKAERSLGTKIHSSS